MLQAIRSRATSFVVKILFGLLIVTFGIWGIGDIFRNRSTDTTVANVGGSEITIDQLTPVVQNQLTRLRSVLGGSIDAEQAKKLGIVDQSVQQMIAAELMALETNRMGLAIGDQAVRGAILGDPNFQDPPGTFNRTLYDRMLTLTHMSEQQFETQTRADILRSQLAGALVAGMTPPKELVDTLYRARAERRTADAVTLSLDAAGPAPSPTEPQLADYYKAHQDDFRTPERRSFRLATVTIDDIAAGIAVSDQDLKKEYDQRQDELGTPEERELQQILVSDEATAKKAADEIAAGKDFAAVAKDIAKEDQKSLDLGWVKKSELPPALADPVFALAPGTATAPIKSAFGWHIVKLVAVRAATQQSFDEAKPKLKTEIARDRAGDQLADLANHIDDAIAGGATLDDVVQKFKLKTATIDAIDEQGRTPDGKDAALPKPRDAVLHAAFGTDSGQMSPLDELGDDGYFVVQVQKVAPSAVQPLAAVHDQAVKLWQTEAREQAIAKLGDALAAEVNAGRSLKDVAAAHKLTVQTIAAFQRDSGDPALPEALVGKLFDAKQGGAAAAPNDKGGYVVAQLSGIEPADPKTDPKALEQLANQLRSGLQVDMLQEYDQALRRHFPVEINQQNLDRVL